MIQPFHVEINAHLAAPCFAQQMRQVTRQSGQHTDHVAQALASARHNRLRRVALSNDFLDEWRDVIDHVEIGIKLLPQTLQCDEGFEKQGQISRQHQGIVAHDGGDVLQ